VWISVGRNRISTSVLLFRPKHNRVCGAVCARFLVIYRSKTTVALRALDDDDGPRDNFLTRRSPLKIKERSCDILTSTLNHLEIIRRQPRSNQTDNRCRPSSTRPRPTYISTRTSARLLYTPKRKHIYIYPPEKPSFLLQTQSFSFRFTLPNLFSFSDRH
jgi:hypothetical protein